jgi:hypothetical protein
MMIFSVLAGVVTELVTDWRASRENQRKIKAAAAEFRQEQARSSENYRQEWELRALEGGDIWPRRLVLALFSFPLVWAYFDPSGVEHYFTVTLNVLPEWYKAAYLSMLAALWGLSELRTLKAGK